MLSAIGGGEFLLRSLPFWHFMNIFSRQESPRNLIHREEIFFRLPGWLEIFFNFFSSQKVSTLHRVLRDFFYSFTESEKKTPSRRNYRTFHSLQTRVHGSVDKMWLNEMRSGLNFHRLFGFVRVHRPLAARCVFEKYFETADRDWEDILARSVASTACTDEKILVRISTTSSCNALENALVYMRRKVGNVIDQLWGEKSLKLSLEKISLKSLFVWI